MVVIKPIDFKPLPNIAPRKAEVAKIVEVLEQDHDSAEQCANKALRAALNLMATRDWYVIANQIDPGAPTMLFGLFATEAAAKKAIENNTLKIMGRATVAKVLGLDARADLINKWELEETPDCYSCGHGYHSHPGPERRKGRKVEVLRGRCINNGCNCPLYERRPNDAEHIEVAI